MNHRLTQRDRLLPLNCQKGVKGFFSEPLEERFWRQVYKTAICWFWLSTLTKGYGHIKVNGRFESAHKISWELHHGQSFPAGKIACHSCDIRQCVNPDHVFPGSKKDNSVDASQKGLIWHEYQYEASMAKKERAIKLFLAGNNYKVIAKIFGCSRQYIQDLLGSQNVLLRSVGMPTKQSQRERIVNLLASYQGQWVPLPVILDLRISQFGARILEARRAGYIIENRTEWEARVKHSFYRLVPKAGQTELFHK
jgi:hypothetical protein